MARDNADAVIFDLDGTLIESEEIWQAVRHEYVLAHRGQWRDGAQPEMMGMRTTEWAQYMHDELRVPLAPETIARDVVAGVAERLGANVPVLPGAQAALERLSRDFRLALATSAALPVAQAVLAKTGWTRFFAVAVSADQVSRGKPAPDVYLRALELLGVQASRTAAIEDSGNGIRSARNAELAVVAIPNHLFPPEPAVLTLASCTLTNLDELNMEVIRSII